VKGKRGLSPNIVRLVRLFVLEAGALLISILLISTAGGIVASIAGYVYDINHAIPDPVTRGDDLGSGLIMVKAALGSLLISLPGSVLVHIYVFKAVRRNNQRALRGI